MNQPKINPRMRARMQKNYNTNKIALADWLTGAPETPSTDQTE